MRIPVRELRPGDVVEQVFMVKDRSYNTTKAGQPFAKIILADATGSVPAMYWDVPDAAKAALETSKFVAVRGSVSTYNNAPQVTIQFLETASPEGLNVADFLPSTANDVAAMFKRLKVVMATVKNEFLIKLVTAIFTDKELCDKLKRAPAASAMHHAYIGGLLEHTLSMAEASLKLCEHYTGLNRDLVLVGVLIHDIGKVDEFAYDTSIEYSDAGRLVGHVAIGIGIIEAKASAIEGFPPALVDLLKHYILSHHGEPEFGAIRQPMTAEALAVHYMDNLDAKLAAFFKAISEHPVPSDNWTAYQKMFEGYLFRGDVFGGRPGGEEPASEEGGARKERGQSLF